MASGTMREPVVSSPQPAITLQSGSPIDETVDTSCLENKANSESSLNRKTPDCKKSNEAKDSNQLFQERLNYNNLSNCKIHFSSFTSPNDLDRPMSYHEEKISLSCKQCNRNFTTKEELLQHGDSCDDKNGDNCSNHSEDCVTSNIRIESNISTNLLSPKSSESKSESFESDDSFRVIKNLRSQTKKDFESKRKSDSDSESPLGSRRKIRTINNNLYSDNPFQCPVCEKDFNSRNVLQLHLENSHPDFEIKCERCNVTFDSPRVLNLHRFMAHNIPEDGKKSETRKKFSFDSPKFRIDRKNLKHIPKVIGFQDINFIDFSSEKFPLIAKNICEKSLHLSKDDFCFDCPYCGRGFPCDTALEIHIETCENNEKRISPKVEKKNKRKSTPKFHPQHSNESDSDDYLENIETKVLDLQRKAFFSSLDLQNTEKSKSAEDEKETEKQDTKSDLADIQSILSVTNIPGIKDFHETKEKSLENKISLNIQINNNQTSPESFSSISLNSPNFNVLNLISPNYSGNDLTEEEAQDCFAAECRRMKLRGEFPCKLCTAIFPNLRALKGHNRVHISVANGTPNSPYRCNICTYNSLDKATLVRHMRSHNGDRPYECAMCNYAFTTKANCERHLRNRHSKITRDEVKSSIIYHPSEDPINDSDYQKTNEMNKRNLEKSKEKQEFPLPMNLKINLSTKENPKGEDLFQTEHQELIKNIKNAEENKKTETGTMTENVEVEKYNNWQYTDNEEALDLRIYKDKNYESDSLDVPQDLSKKEDVKEFNNNIEEKPVKNHSENYISQYYDSKPNLDINNLVKIYSNMYPNLNVTQMQQIILTQLNFPGILQKMHNFPFSPFLLSSPLFSNSNNYLQKNVQKDIIGLQMSGGNILDEKNHSLTMSEKLHFFQQQALAEIMFKREKERISNDCYGKNLHIEDVEKHKRFSDFMKQNDFFSEEKKSFGEILSRKDEKKEPVRTNISEKLVDSRNSSVKMVIKNGVLIPKQKQRRYRTERPFSCEHCSARFTLRSNMERHIKQQHPQHWTQKSRSNVGNLKKSDQNSIKLNSCDRDFETACNRDYYNHYDVEKPISLLSRDNLNTSGGEIKWDVSSRCKRDFIKQEVMNLSQAEKEAKVKKEEEDEEIKDELIIDEEKNADVNKVREKDLSNAMPKYLKVKQLTHETETDEGAFKRECKDLAKESQPQDLASVSKMLDNAVTQTQAFQKFFQDGPKKEEIKKENDEVKKDEEERSEEEEGFIAGSTSSDENRQVFESSPQPSIGSKVGVLKSVTNYRSESEVSSKSGKKKSAYSLAPNRVSCPYCFRKFPWTSSLRRHVLTHTGQKPFKCTHCPLLFTTKSNCDRHLLRKHGREALLASSGQTENHESSGSISVANSSNTTQNNNYIMRNVPERPYKCNQCPSSTFSTLSNLNKHLFSKHNTQPKNDSADETVEDKLKNPNPHAPPNVTVSSSFPISRNLSIIPPYAEKMKMTIKSPGMDKVMMTNDLNSLNGIEGDKEESRMFKKRSSSDETEATERKRTSPDLAKIANHEPHDSGTENHRELLPILPSELPFKCHLCDSSFGERTEALEHIRCQHPNEFQLLISKGALETNTDEEKHQHDENEEILDSTRGRFPDYANRKVMCAFCMRRFWSAEDLRRHMRTHTGERPFSCDVCQRRFTLKHSMLRHRKKHSAHEEVLAGSDEEHHHPYRVNHNNNISLAMTAFQKPADVDENLQRTILHQTLTRCGDAKDDLRKEINIQEKVEESNAFK